MITALKNKKNSLMLILINLNDFITFRLVDYWSLVKGKKNRFKQIKAIIKKKHLDN